MPSGNVPTSPTSPSAVAPSQKDHCTNKTTRSMSYDPTEYVQRARVTKAAPPKPAANPLQFVQMKPCNLYQSAQEQLKRAEEVKKVKEIIKEEPEDWQSNLDNWKSGRRKRVEHIIDRVVEAKKLEMEELDRNRKKSKTFSEMMEERESKGRKCSLPVYNDDEDANEFNGFGYRANDTISGKSSVSEDYENQSVNSDNTLDSDKHRFIDSNSNNGNYRRDSESSPGFDDNTSNSTLSAASPDLAYTSSTYNGSRIPTTTLTSNFSRVSVESWAEKHHAPSANHTKPKPRLTPKIEGHLASYETKMHESHAEQDERNANVSGGDKIDLPKIDISSRRELFEKEQKAQFQRTNGTKKPITLTENAETSVSIKERLSHLERRHTEEQLPKEMAPVKPNRNSGDFSGVRDRFSHAEHGQFVTIEPKAPKIDVPVVPLKERLLNLESSMATETQTQNGKHEHRTKKMTEPKSIAINNKSNGNNLNVIDNNNESVTSSPVNIDEPRHLKEDEDSGINSDDLQSSLASQQSQPQQMTDHVGVNSQHMGPTSPPLSPKIDRSMEPVPAARKPEVLPRRQITPDLVKITSNLNIEDDLLQSQDEIDDEADNSVIDALDIALNAIDTEKPNELINIATSFDEIYEEINEFKPLKAASATAATRNANKEKAANNEGVQSTSAAESKPNKVSSIDDGETVDEPYYQVPKKQNESYYEVPSSRPIPVYENVDMFYDSTSSSHKLSMPSASKLPVPIDIGTKMVKQPPKEKPPPPPIESNDEAESEGAAEEEPLPQDAMKRINSTKRIKKEIRNKRSSFLGIEGNVDDESFLEINVAPPPDMAALLKEERRIEKQLYMKAGLYDSSDTAESRDSGVSENHSRQSSEPVTSSSEEQEQDANQQLSALEMDKKLLEAGKNALALECRARGTQEWVYNNNDDFDPILKALEERERARCIDDQNREEADILRVERELLELEQEEMKRKNMLNRKLHEQQRLLAQQQQQLQEQQLQEQQQQQPIQVQQKQEVQHRHSLQDINGNGNASLYANVYANNYHAPMDHRKSMPNLQDMTLREAVADKIVPPIPPAKPLRVQEYLKYGKQLYGNGGLLDSRANQSMPMHLNSIHNQSNEDFRPYTLNGSGSGGGGGSSSNNSINGSYSNMSRHTLHALSAVPKPKFVDTWAHNNNYENTNENGWHSSRDYIDPENDTYIRPRNKEPIGDTWLSMQQKRRSDPQNFNYNKHWLIQEAEQRRIDQARRSNGYTNGEWSQLNGSGCNNSSTSKIIPRKGSNDNKPLPDAVIQTLTQRVQNKLSDKKRLESQQNHYHYHHHPHQTLGSSTEQLVSPQHQHNTSYHQLHQPHPHQPHQLLQPQHQPALQLDSSRLSDEAPREILSVSGKKKCSYCGEELGRGAAMIIESLRLFYHLDCFKCCVCRVQLGDGISGADVRVRNQKLHCNNCFSSDDGVKFSCV